MRSLGLTTTSGQKRRNTAGSFVSMRRRSKVPTFLRAIKVQRPSGIVAAANDGVDRLRR